MSRKNLIIVIIVGIVIGIGAITTLAYSLSQNLKPKDNTDYVLRTTEVATLSSASTTPSNLASSTSLSTSTPTSSSLPTVASFTVSLESGYIKYDQSKLSNAKSGRVVIFFHAAWCPSCKSLEEDILKNADSIPKDMLIMKLDYDDSLDLKRKYGVTMQHTLVQVDQRGESIKSSRGLYQLTTLESILGSFPKS